MAEVIKRNYESKEFSEREKKDIQNARTRAVQHAWKQEKQYVKEGKGTRDWTEDQQRDIVKNGSVQGFEGHHMRSVSNGKTYEEQMKIAGNKDNIQFLEKTGENNEHLRAHDGNTRNRTNGYYNVKTGKTKDFGEGEPKAPKAEKLSNPVMKEEKGKTEGGKAESGKSNTDRYGVDMSKAETKKENTQGKHKTR